MCKRVLKTQNRLPDVGFFKSFTMSVALSCVDMSENYFTYPANIQKKTEMVRKNIQQQLCLFVALILPVLGWLETILCSLPGSCNNGATKECDDGVDCGIKCNGPGACNNVTFLCPLSGHTCFLECVGLLSCNHVYVTVYGSVFNASVDTKGGIFIL